MHTLYICCHKNLTIKFFSSQAVAANAFTGSSMLSLLKTEGFLSIGRVPQSGHLQGKGWTDSLIMYKELVSSGQQVYIYLLYFSVIRRL